MKRYTDYDDIPLEHGGNIHLKQLAIAFGLTFVLCPAAVFILYYRGMMTIAPAISQDAAAVFPGSDLLPYAAIILAVLVICWALEQIGLWIIQSLIRKERQ